MGLKVGESAAEAAAAAVEELRRDTTRRWLLIFDNADNPKDLEPHLPAGPGHVLITSRNQTWTHSVEPLEVDVFTEDESVAHILRHVPELDLADTKKVAEALGRLPLAVEQAGAWLQQTGKPARALSLIHIFLGQRAAAFGHADDHALRPLRGNDPVGGAEWQ